MNPSQLSIVSTSPQVPTASAVSSLTVTFNHNLTSEEKASLVDLIIAMVGNSENTGSHEQCEFTNGTIGIDGSGIGTYTFGTKTMMLSFGTSKYVSVFELDV